MYLYKFTVFTATFNRASTLENVYLSLLSQTFKNFEWLIIDDGSTDDTEILVKKWQQENNFLIRYYYQENKGKPSASNRAVTLAQGEHFLNLDSDDSCVPRSLEIFNNYWEMIPDDQKAFFCGCAVLTMKRTGKINGNFFSNGEFIDSNLHSINVRGEKWGFTQTDIFKKFPFPVFEYEKYISESIVWNRIGLHYKTRFINQALRIYDNDHNHESITKRFTEIRMRYPKGHQLQAKEFSQLPISYLKRLRGIINYLRFSLHAKEKMGSLLQINNYSISYLIAVLPAYFIFKRDLKANPHLTKDRHMIGNGIETSSKLK